MKKWLLASVAALALSACKEVEFSNGEVPEEYLSEARKLEGLYKGSFAGDRYDLVISFNGNKPALEFVGQRPDACKFVFGEVLSASAKENEDKSISLRRVTFALESESCYSAIGRTIDLEISEKDGKTRLDAHVLLEERYEQDCRWMPAPPPPGYAPPPGYSPGYPPGSYCHWERRPYYLSGRFVKQ